MVSPECYFGLEDEGMDSQDAITRRAMQSVRVALVGVIGVGDYVKTLHLKRAIYGKVARIKKRRAWVEGREQPGKPLLRRETSVENLELHFKAGCLPEKYRAEYEEYE